MNNEETINSDEELKVAEEQKKILEAALAKLNKELEDIAAALKVLEEQGKQGGAS